MLPALFAGITGLKVHQTRLNNIGNNLANVNTVGFKSSRVTFSDLVYQTVRDASAPQNGSGGTNPIQVGLGSLVATVDSIQTQGNLESTGRSTDLAIQGRGFFVLGDNTQTVYGRAGNVSLGTDGNLFNPSNGFKFKGWNAVNGAVDTSKAVENISVPIGQTLAAKASSSIVFGGNLDASGSVTLGTITGTQRLLAAAAGTDLATNLINSTGTNLGIQSGDVINITGSVGATAITGQTLTVGAATNLTNIASAIQTALRSVADGDLTETATVQSDGSIRVTSDTSNAITNLQLTITGKSTFNNAFDYPATISGGGGTGDSNTLRAAATGTDTLVNLFNSSGTSLGLVANDDLTLISATAKGTALSNVSLLANIGAGTTYENYRAALQTALFSAFPITGEAVTVQSDGSLQITGATGAANAITGIDIGAGPSANDDTRAVFGASQVATQTQAAVDAASFKTTGQVFDSLGNGLNLTLTFTKTASNTWSWTAENGTTNVGSGVLTYTAAGALSSSTGTISVSLTNGATTPLAVTPDFSNSSQFAGSSSIVVNSQDGFATSTLTNFSIGQTGEITGVFTNGQNKLLGQLAMAIFQNPGGLTRNGRSLLSQSPNSGLPQVGAPGTSSRGTLVAGTLEMSNVDVAQEFTDLIVTQRGFQSNARVITTSDALLEELVNIKR